MANPALRIALIRGTLLATVLLWVLPVAATVPTPASFFGFQPGTDRELIDYGQLIDYLEALDAGSDRLELREVGSSPEGRPMYVAFLSTEQNIAALEELRQINRRLALEPDLSAQEQQQLINTGKVFLMATLSMHSGEVGPSQSLPIFAHELVTTDNEELLQAMAEVVLMIVPCHNPDGMEMVVSHYRTYKGTRYEGSSLPGVYHRYVGHDNNRDFVTLTQEDTRVISHLISREWYPQVLVEKHQMGGSGPRYFVPPNHDPIAENVDDAVLHWTGVFGAALARDMTRDGLTGVAQHWLFDDYWPGSTETGIWKGVIAFLTEAASCQTAKPVFVEPTELRVDGKGLAEYKKSVNMLKPWPGGWWRLGDIVAYELSSMHSILETAALYRKDILQARNQLTSRAVHQGLSEAPYYFVLPARQHDRSAMWQLVALLLEHGVAVHRLTADIELGDRLLHRGDLVVPLAQPYRPFIKEVMERQTYPVRHYTPNGKVIKPYDITTWSLPLHAGVSCLQIDTRAPQLEQQLSAVTETEIAAELTAALPETLWALALPATDNSSFRDAFAALEQGLSVSRLTAAAVLPGPAHQTLPAGSFLILNDGVTRQQLEQLVAGWTMPPVVLESTLELSTRPLVMPRIALVETWFHDMDAGWTRYLLDSYHVPFTVLRPADFAETDLAGRFDVVVFPSMDANLLKEGAAKDEDQHYHATYPPEYSKGLGTEGMDQLMSFLDQGGLIVSWGDSTELFLGELTIKKAAKATTTRGKKKQEEQVETETFQLPVRDISKKAKKAGLDVPGSLLEVELLPDHPLTWGMPAQTGVFSRGKPVLRTSIPSLDMDRRVIAWFPEKDLLLSGYLEGEQQLQRTAAMVWLQKGAGQLVLLSFSPQFRASTPATYKLLFNALLLPGLED